MLVVFKPTFGGPLGTFGGGGGRGFLEAQGGLWGVMKDIFGAGP